MKRYLYILTSILFFVACSATGTHKSLDNNSFQELLKQEGVQLVDVRTPEEYKEGHILNAILMDVKDSLFVDEVDIRLSKDKPVAVYCRSGKRSKKASDILVSKGYTVFELSSGMNGWLEDNLPIEK